MTLLRHRSPLLDVTIAIVGLMVFAGSAHASAGPDRNETLRVFLLAGQSNAEGADTNAAEVDSYPPFVGAAEPQPDVLFWYETDSAPLTSGGWIALQPELQLSWRSVGRRETSPQGCFG